MTPAEIEAVLDADVTGRGEVGEALRAALAPLGPEGERLAAGFAADVRALAGRREGHVGLLTALRRQAAATAGFASAAIHPRGRG